MHWAEGDRAPWRHDQSAVPGIKPEGGRHDAALSSPFGIGTKAANRHQCDRGFSSPVSHDTGFSISR